ncbi:Inositol 2-dehydrogenase [Agrobacterium tumefaciens str. Kerr 14]|uniref:Inositol 2-dehydrogenase n=1 Tax=Agrobacterium tumefaciens str. Kerr 14 TaxID=1183424 RepID=A0A1S7SAC2_AGRTU|nr:inositol 2-dehydrogenase [Agrobacterium tumefaciens]CUX65253.1 Inositol 2-dehydrogenase [Agrobacterium tumefaciens str. Kerr 14]
MAEQKPLRIALFGAGRMGQIHATTIASHPRAQLIAVVDPNVNAARELATRHGCNVLDDDSVFRDKTIDAVVIASAASAHPEQIKSAALAGKAIFCEKPLARDLESVRQIVDTVEEHQVVFLLGFNRRFDRHFQDLKAKLGPDGVGSPEIVILTSRDPRPPPGDYVRAAGGIIRETTIHDIDMARYLTGEDPAFVFGMAASRTEQALEDGAFDDTVVVTMRMPSGCLVTINNSWRASYGYDQRAEVHARHGMMRLDNVLPTTVSFSGEIGTVTDKPEPFFMERYMEAYRREMESFISAAGSGSQLVPTARDGLKALEIAEAVERSIAQNKVISL